MSNKLELTWYGKDTPICVEPRLLIENAALSNCAARFLIWTRKGN